jgi:transcriptional activator SPT8
MVAFALDDDYRGSNASSDNEQDELIEEVEEPEVEVDLDADGEAEDDENEEAEDNMDEDPDQDEDRLSDSHQTQVHRPSLPTTNTSSGDTSVLNQTNYTNGAGPTSHPQPKLIRTSASPRQASAPLMSPRVRPIVRPEALSASLYDIVPTMAAPHSTSINAIAATPDMRYWFSGGTDCYVRKYDGAATVNGKTLLTVAQRHPFVDSVTKAGVLMSYWENEEPILKNPNEEHALSPVYSLAVQSQALWLLSGLESGCINLLSVRHDEGKRIAYLQKHASAVSVLTLAQDEKSVLSGSWDKNVFDWDLNTGQVKRSFEGSGGQISAIEVRPASSLPVPEESGEPTVIYGTFSSNNGDKPFTNGSLSNGANGNANGFSAETDGNEDAPGSPVDTDSLFGDGGNSLFGDPDGAGAPSGGNFGADDDDEFSRAIEMGIDDQERLDSQGDLATGATDTVPAAEAGDRPALAVNTPEGHKPNGFQSSPAVPMNGLSHSNDAPGPSAFHVAETQDAVATSDSTFLAASTDGTLRIWDRRQPNPVALIPIRTGVPPWCMGACWSPDGNFIYAGRRNGTVEEFSLHKGLKSADRTFKFPQGSGAVSAVRAMPNGRHLIWYVVYIPF